MLLVENILISHAQKHVIGLDQVMRICVTEHNTYDILHACHDETYGGYLSTKNTTLK